TVCVVGKMRDLILQLSKSSIYSTKPNNATDLIKIKALCEMLEISYPALKQRIYRGEDVDTAIRELLAKGGE
ncbi:hypothetical protein ACLHXY_24100, partial [Klebsiella quasipneumoniae]|uniref:hypothetical protein n=1 Tax=Klebsiella quasipneumoniae TaxID=1463165 RepID=UPI003983D540